MITAGMKAHMRKLLTAGQNAVRAAEECGSQRTVDAVYEALCALPLVDMEDDAYGRVQVAVRAAAAAEDAETWTLLYDAEHSVSQWLHEPDGHRTSEAAVMDVARLAVHCSARVSDAGSVESRAWYRAFQAGVEALRAVTGAVSGHVDSRALDKAMTQFWAAVRRAVPYAAMYVAKEALVEFARTYGFFVVEMRQPAEGGWEWMRRLGDAVYLFRVDTPGLDGFPYGSVTVQRIGKDGTPGWIRPFALTSLPASIGEARDRI